MPDDIEHIPPDAIVHLIRTDADLNAEVRNLLHGALRHAQKTLAVGSPTRQDRIVTSMVPALIRAMKPEEERDDKYDALREEVAEMNRQMRAQMGGGRIIDAESEEVPVDTPPSTPIDPRMDAEIRQGRASHPSTQLRAVPDNGS